MRDGSGLASRTGLSSLSSASFAASGSRPPSPSVSPTNVLESGSDEQANTSPRSITRCPMRQSHRARSSGLNSFASCMLTDLVDEPVPPLVYERCVVSTVYEPRASE